MHPFLASLRAPFLERVGASRLHGWFAYRARRGPLTLGLALVPALLYLGLSVLVPRMESEDRVVSVLSRSISGLITAATIAVGFGTLALRRGIIGIGELEEHVRDDERFRARARELTGEEDLPLEIGPFLARVHGALMREARAARAEPGTASLRDGAHGIVLVDYLDALERQAARAKEGLEAAEGEPAAALSAALDFDHDVAEHLGAAFEREPAVPEAVRARLRRIQKLLDLARISTAYLKSLDTQWGVARMSRWIALSSFAAVFVCAFVTMGYGGGAGWVALALFALALPLAAFVSHVMRHVFVHQHSLPLGGFTLGPENEKLNAERPR